MRTGPIITALLIVLLLSFGGAAQNRGIEFVSGPEFKLPQSAVAAGIDGTLTVFLKVDRSGNVMDVDIFAGPIWPCNSSPDAAIREVREAVKKNLLASKFSPATKNGKPIDAHATLDFAIGIAYREAISGRTNAKSKWVVDVETLQQRATYIPKPMYTGIPGSVTVRVLIDEKGAIIAAGAVRGDPRLHWSSRRAACDAKFPPTIADGRPIKATGLIHYDFTRGSVRAR